MSIFAGPRNVTEYGIDRDKFPSGMFSYTWETVNHEELGKALSEYQLESVIVLREHLADHLASEPAYVHITSEISCSEIEEMARREIGHNDYDMEEAFAELQKYGLCFEADNQLIGEEKEIADNKLKNELIDRYFESLRVRLYPDMISILHHDFKLEFMAGLRKKKEKFDLAVFSPIWRDRLNMALAPRTTQTWERRYDRMPHPFSNWDSRNSWQQFYFIKDEDGLIHWVRGGSGGSGTREDHGRYAHTFMVADKIKPIPTSLYKYTSASDFVPVKSWKHFMAVNCDLNGNYKASYDETKILFQDRLLHTDGSRYSDDGAQKEVSQAW